MNLRRLRDDHFEIWLPGDTWQRQLRYLAYPRYVHSQISEMELSSFLGLSRSSMLALARKCLKTESFKSQRKVLERGERACSYDPICKIPSFGWTQLLRGSSLQKTSSPDLQR